jgi:hypothetical protein
VTFRREKEEVDWVEELDWLQQNRWEKKKQGFREWG